MYIYTPLCSYWITLYRYILVFIVPHVDIELEDNKQFISNIPRMCSRMTIKQKWLIMICLPILIFLYEFGTSWNRTKTVLETGNTYTFVHHTYRHTCTICNRAVEISTLFTASSWISLFIFLFFHKNICCGYSLELPQTPQRSIKKTIKKKKKTNKKKKKKTGTWTAFKWASYLQVICPGYLLLLALVI